MKKYDVVIIGGGIGGLASGVILSKEGLKVCLLEQHSVIGGCLQSFRRNGRILDTGMHYVGSLSKGQILHQYFKYMGIVDELRLQKLDENGYDCFHFPDGENYCHAMGYDRFTDTLAAQFPKERAGLEELVKNIKKVGELITPEILRQGMIYNRGGNEYMSVSAYGEIGKYIKDERLINVLAGNAGLYSGDKLTTSMYEYSVITDSYIQGAYAFIDGSQHLADLLTREIESNGGDVVLNAKVTKIHLEEGKVEFVELENGERYTAEWTISSIHPTTTFSLLENNTVYKKAFFTRMNSLANTYGIFTTYLLLKPGSMKYVNRNNFFFNNSNVWTAAGEYKGVNLPGALMFMQPNSNSDCSDVVSILVPMHFNRCEKWSNTKVGNRGSEYKEFKEKFSSAAIDFVSQYNPALKGCIEKVYTASPLTYRDYTSTPEGCAYGLIKDCRKPIASMIYARTKIPNLLITGQSLNIHGCLGTTISAAVTCSEILGEEYVAKKIGNA